jgi:hypothetical protein
VKARGLGLSLPLDGISLLLEADRIAVRFAPSLEDREDEWQFALFRPSAEHSLAVALKQDEGMRHRRIVVRRCIPLGADELGPDIRAIATTAAPPSQLA